MTDQAPLMVLKWAWRYGVLDVDDFDSIDEAVRSAVWASGASEESFAGIEVVYEDGRTEVVDVAEQWRKVEQEEEEERASYPPTKARLDLRSQQGQWALFRTFADAADAERDAAELRDIFGADRVRVRPVSS